jgi:long-chain acyl-CoA synthetase
MNIAEWLAASARLKPDAPALLRGERVEADYAAFARRAAAVGHHLATRHGIAPGDRVALFAHNATQYLECLYGVWWIGAVVIPINAKLHGREAAWICNNGGAKLAFVSTDTAAPLREANDELQAPLPLIAIDDDAFGHIVASGEGLVRPAPRADDDLAWLFYTSGTTGRPKGVMLSHGNLVAMSLCYPSDVDSVAHEDAALYAAPLSHGAGLYNFIHVRMAARHVVPLSGGFEPDEVLDLAKRLRNVSMFAAPTMVRRLVDAAKARGEDGDGIKTIVYGGGPMYLADIRDAIATMGQRFVQIYGQGESPMTITSLPRAFHADTEHPRYLERLSSVGVAQSMIEVRITDSDGNVLPAGEAGEFVAKGPPGLRG